MTTKKKVRRFKSVDEMVQKLSGPKFKKLWAERKKAKRVRKWRAFAVIQDTSNGCKEELIAVHKYRNHLWGYEDIDRKIVPVEIREVRR